MPFDNLSIFQKRKYWKETEIEISKCLSLAQSLIPSDISKSINEYLSHNELGLATELLADFLIENDLIASFEVNQKLLNLFNKMGYPEDEPQQYSAYQSYFSQQSN